MIKTLLKKTLGQTNINLIKSLKARYLPSGTEREDLYRRKRFYSGFIKEGDLCFDVGANIGNRIEPLLQVGARIVAVEPQESCYKVLRKVYGKSIELVTEGLSDREEIRDFFVSDVTIVSSFSKEWIDSVKDRFTRYKWDKVLKIKMTTLDKLIEKFGVPVFIKIDVEGYELEVLKGLSAPVKMISFEYTVPEQTDKVIECITQIQSVNGEIECNYCIEESMELALEQWLLADTMKELVTAKEFLDTRFGDVYVRTKVH